MEFVIYKPGQQTLLSLSTLCCKSLTCEFSSTRPHTLDKVTLRRSHKKAMVKTKEGGYHIECVIVGCWSLISWDGFGFILF